ncbi:YrbL family protein [Vibrio sp. WXL210]|uniref:YrbL family protein n=1 Tax=Vibrio sp. WXL210 TaxID=3450709 RepID=UPI003EC5A31A
MIEINSQFHIASGLERDVYLHPQNNNICIKIQRPRLSVNERESFFLNKYKACPSFPDSYGFVDTNLGKGLMVELIRDYDGQISKPLSYYLCNNIIVLEDCLDYLNELKNTYLDYNVLSRDRNLNNILLRKDSEFKFSPIVVDGLGWVDNTKNNIRMKFSFFVRKKIKLLFENLSAEVRTTHRVMNVYLPTARK